MLDSETKRRIDSARDILVGKVPDPKSQVEQITIALIYKFMDDMDAEAEELGGKRKFFTGEFARYGWAKLMSTGIGGHELIGLYGEGIAKMLENPGIPPLFRDIFKNAYLPYRDPETLKSFLKIINEFSYDHSEDLGDAFEYLLSVLGSQGDAGQFRTPRHIIDFIVDIIEPKKDEVILDPACGTAGFLISAYKYILRTNKDAKSANTLTPDEKGRLAQHFKGYDISPDMVRLSLTNLYLHGFSEPHVYEYDTLTSEERWNEYADVILANPPFMSPKGGIKPHKRFSIQAQRSEVLFVDYMAEHLTIKGRAGIIVPEGIIFQSQTAYKTLRKMLVENSLVCIISLPAGVFQPYSGVKTSILILDKSLAKKTDSILFLKIQNDGTDLGARRKLVSNSQLPTAVSIYRHWSNHIINSTPIKPNELPDGCNATIISKIKIAADGEYNLTAERYRELFSSPNNKFPMIKLGEIVKECTLRVKENTLPIWSVSNKLGFVNTEDYFDKQVASSDTSNYKIVSPDSFAYNPSRINVGSIALNLHEKSGAVSPMYVVFKSSSDRISANFLFELLKSERLNSEINRVAQGAIRIQLRFNDLANLTIPLPPLEIQNKISEEIKCYRKIIEGASTVLANYQPHIQVQPEWPIVDLGEICSFKNGLNFSKTTSGHAVKIIGVKDFQQNLHAPTTNLDVVELDSPLSDEYLLQPEDILFVRSNGNPDLVGRSMIVSSLSGRTTFSGFTIRGRIIDKRALPLFYAHFFKSRDFAEMIKTVGQGANIRNLSQSILYALKVPLPPIATQKSIISEIEKEQQLVSYNIELIEHFEKKIQGTLAQVWN